MLSALSALCLVPLQPPKAIHAVFPSPTMCPSLSDDTFFQILLWVSPGSVIQAVKWFWYPNPAVPTNSQLFVGVQHGLDAQDYKFHCSAQPQVLRDKSLFTTDEVQIKARLKQPPVISWVPFTLCGCASERLLSLCRGTRWAGGDLPAALFKAAPFKTKGSRNR